MYQVGDRVVHPMHGAGIIESIVQERLGGQLGSYYVFRMPSGGLTLKIPTGSCGAIGVRALSHPGGTERHSGAGDRPHHQLEPTLSGEPEPAEERRPAGGGPCHQGPYVAGPGEGPFQR